MFCTPWRYCFAERVSTTTCIRFTRLQRAVAFRSRCFPSPSSARRSTAVRFVCCFASLSYFLVLLPPKSLNMQNYSVNRHETVGPYRPVLLPKDRRSSRCSPSALLLGIQPRGEWQLMEQLQRNNTHGTLDSRSRVAKKNGEEAEVPHAHFIETGDTTKIPFLKYMQDCNSSCRKF